MAKRKVSPLKRLLGWRAIHEKQPDGSEHVYYHPPGWALGWIHWWGRVRPRRK